MTLDPPEVGPTNSSCFNSTPMTWTGTVFTASGSTVGANDDSDATCDANGPDVVYSFSTNAEHKVTASLTPTGGFPGAVYTRRTCEGRGRSQQAACASASTTTNAPRVAVAEYLPAGTWYVWVGPGKVNEVGAFNLEVKLETPPIIPPVNDTCRTAIAVEQGATYEGDTTTAIHDYGDNPLSPICEAMATANPISPDLVYTYTPRADGPFTVTVTPESTYNPMLWIMEGSCDSQGLNCTAATNDHATREPESLTMQGVAADLIDSPMNTRGRKPGHGGPARARSRERVPARAGFSAFVRFRGGREMKAGRLAGRQASAARDASSS